MGGQAEEGHREGPGGQSHLDSWQLGQDKGPRFLQPHTPVF